MFEFFMNNNLTSSDQSGFKPGDSCINQLLSITFINNIITFINLLMMGLRLEAFSLIFAKCLTNGASGNLLSMLTDFLRGRKQMLVLNEQYSS